MALCLSCPKYLLLFYYLYKKSKKTYSPQRRLTQKYSIAVGVPTLVIRGRHVRDQLLDDALGEKFPWPAPPLHEVLRGVHLQGDGESRLYEELPVDAVRVFYFAAHWVSVDHFCNLLSFS